MFEPHIRQEAYLETKNKKQTNKQKNTARSEGTVVIRGLSVCLLQEGPEGSGFPPTALPGVQASRWETRDDLFGLGTASASGASAQDQERALGWPAARAGISRS